MFLEVRIVKELWTHFLEVRILKDLLGLALAEEAARRDERFVRTVSSANTGNNSTVFT